MINVPELTGMDLDVARLTLAFCFQEEIKSGFSREVWVSFSSLRRIVRRSNIVNFGVVDLAAVT